MKKALAILMTAVLCLCLFAGCGGKTETPAGNDDAADSAYILEKGKLIVGITNYEPMDFRGDDGEWTGFDAEFARAFAEKFGVEVEFIEIDWDNKLVELDSKSIDCIWNGMTITPEIEQGASVSAPYVRNAQVVVMAADKIANYPDAASLKDLQFAVESGSAGAKVAKKAGFTKITEVGTQTAAMMEVSSGAADACVIDLTMANAMTGEGTSYADYGYSVELSAEEYGVAFRKGSDMAEQFNRIMDELKADGTLNALAEKYELTLA